MCVDPTPSGESPLTACSLLAKRQRVADGAKILLDIAKESSDWFAPLKSVLGGVCALIKHIEVIVQWIRLSCTTDAEGHSNLKMWRRGSRSLSCVWTGSSRTPT